MADVNLPLRNALRDLADQNQLDTSPLDKPDLREVVVALGNTFTDSRLEVLASTIILCDFFAKPGNGGRADEPRRFVIRAQWEDDDLRLSLEEVVWGDGSDPGDWRVRDKITARTMSDVIGWTSWVLQELPSTIPHKSPLPPYRLPNLQHLCWHLAPTPSPPFIKIRLGGAIYEESPSTRWSIRFPRPGMVSNCQGSVNLLPNPTGTGAGFASDYIKTVVATIEDKANEILQSLGKQPATATHKGWGDPPLTQHPRNPVLDAVFTCITEYTRQMGTSPQGIVLHPAVLAHLLKDTYFPDTMRGNMLDTHIFGFQTKTDPSMDPATIAFINRNGDATCWIKMDIENEKAIVLRSRQHR